jgi:hypothetical protein
MPSYFYYCPSPFSVYQAGATCYYKIPTTSSWTAAKTTCATYGATLVTINDAVENNYVYSTYGSVWSGYNDISVEGNFVWDSGFTSTYTNWAASQPDNAGEVEDCVKLQFSNTTIWYDIQCSNFEVGLCELAANTTYLTHYPTSMPSVIPSSEPSSMPSEMPSASPSNLPLSMPSEFPTAKPSSTPSSIPSAVPTDIPTIGPSMPSSAPSATPSRSPSSMPSEMPSASPSNLPSSMPS